MDPSFSALSMHMKPIDGRGTTQQYILCVVPYSPNLTFVVQYFISVHSLSVSLTLTLVRCRVGFRRICTTKDIQTSYVKSRTQVRTRATAKPAFVLSSREICRDDTTTRKIGITQRSRTRNKPTMCTTRAAAVVQASKSRSRSNRTRNHVLSQVVLLPAIQRRRT